MDAPCDRKFYEIQPPEQLVNQVYCTLRVLDLNDIDFKCVFLLKPVFLEYGVNKTRCGGGSWGDSY